MVGLRGGKGGRGDWERGGLGDGEKGMKDGGSWRGGDLETGRVGEIFGVKSTVFNNLRR